MWFIIDKHSDFSEILLSISIWGFVLDLIVALICLISYYDYKTNMVKFQGCKQSIENSRSYELSEFERVSIQNKIIEWNEWLYATKYTNTLWINCVPNNIELLEPIK